MYAVIKTGGKQYKVTPGYVLRIEKIKTEVGTTFDFPEVLMVAKDDDIRIGAPRLADGKVTATVLEHGRDKKITIVKFKRRKHHLKRRGHRQHYTDVRITGIAAEGISEIWEPKPKPVPVEATPPETETETQAEAMSSEMTIETQKIETLSQSSSPKSQDTETTPQNSVADPSKTDTQKEELKKDGT
jgi:large subunit ribosomal protein L21